jgi:hypothetical protein
MKKRQLSILRLIMFIIVFSINILFIISIFQTNSLKNNHPDIWIKIFLIWLLVSNTILHKLLNQYKTKSDFHYVDTLYRMNKGKKK